VIAAIPAKSTRRVTVSSRDSGVANSVTTSAPAATGRLMKKIDCQETCSTHAAEDRAYRQGQRGDSGPGADRLAALVRREGMGDDRQRRRHHERGADALDRAAADQPRLALREPDEGARRGEHSDADKKDLAPAKDVAEPPAGDEQDAEDQRVGVDGPLQAR